MAEHEASRKLSVLSLKPPGQLYLDPVTDRAANVRTWEGKFICSVVLERIDDRVYVRIDTRELEPSGVGGSLAFSYPIDVAAFVGFFERGAHTVTRCEPEDLARTILTMRVRGEL